MNRLSILLVACLIMILGSGCEKKCSQLDICRIYQDGYNASPSIIGYFANDVDTQIVLHYKPNGLFDQLVDSSGFIDTYVTGGYIYNTSDTQELVLGYSGGTFGSQQVNDMKLVLPGVRTYYFTDIMVDGDYVKNDEFTCSNGSGGCVRRVISMKVDGVPHYFPDYTTRLILHK